LFKILVTLFILVPLLEIYLLIKVGAQIGAVPTLLLILLTAVFGAFLLRLQGLLTLARIKEATGRGELPARSLVEGLILLLAGAMLLTPGFFTDLLGFVCLIPALREHLARYLLRGFFSLRLRERPAGPVIIEGEFREEDTREQSRQRELDRQ
jgi:UPF0716 protein FxsA